MLFLVALKIGKDGTRRGESLPSRMEKSGRCFVTKPPAPILRTEKYKYIFTPIFNLFCFQKLTSALTVRSSALITDSFLIHPSCCEFNLQTLIVTAWSNSEWSVPGDADVQVCSFLYQEATVIKKLVKMGFPLPQYNTPGPTITHKRKFTTSLPFSPSQRESAAYQCYCLPPTGPERLENICKFTSAAAIKIKP